MSDDRFVSHVNAIMYICAGLVKTCVCYKSEDCLEKTGR